MHQTLFDAAAESSDLALQLCYFRGIMELYASSWLSNALSLRSELDAVYCEGGATQIARLIEHSLNQFPNSQSVKAIIFVGDACEEIPDQLNALAVRCRLAKRPLLLFQEGRDPNASRCFSSMAALSGGAHIALDNASGDRLRDLLKSAVKFATGGRKALQGSSVESDKLLLQKLSSPKPGSKA